MPNRDSELSVIIPAYNEAENLRALLPGLLRFCRENHYELIVINDGSRDETEDVLEPFKNLLKILRHKVNRGYGAAIKTGIRNADTQYIVTIDADGQHQLPDINTLFAFLKANDADMVVGSRGYLRTGSLYRSVGKWIIRNFIPLFLKLTVHDINSGMKVYRTDLAKKYVEICPDSMAFSDVITLIFINENHLVLEHPITVGKRIAGESTVSTYTAFETVMEILKGVLFLRPMRFFFPLAMIFIVFGMAWGIPIMLHGRGISVGAGMSLLAGVIFFVIGLILEQLWLIIKNRL